jgi:hypothetical protein
MEAQRKRVLIGRLYMGLDPKPGRANHEQGDYLRNQIGGPNSSELQICEMTCG